MTITIFEVQYEGTPDNYQSRIIEVEDWNTYVENVKNYRAHNSLDYTTPKTAKLINMIERHEQLEFDYIVPANGKLRHHMSWKVQMKH